MFLLGLRDSSVNRRRFTTVSSVAVSHRTVSEHVDRSQGKRQVTRPVMGDLAPVGEDPDSVPGGRP